MAYCTADDVRAIAPLTTSDISDVDLAPLITYATAILNAEILQYHEDERIEYINDEKENKIDGSNTTFYTKNWPIADSDNDGDVDTDDIYVYELDSEGNRTDLTVSSITPKHGKFVLSSAPESSKRLYVTYYSSEIDAYTPHNLIKKACCELVAALAFTKIQAKDLPKLNVGGLSVSFPKSYELYMKKYRETLNDIRKEIIQEEKYGD